ncbi:GNAT family N-acetyltransferase [Lederbergia citri]|uniref:GNAT family N-acetyltransferase n=1 Tax=Lederbergia citri TaxID=2833580 RepID=A0A942YJL7_9BACI|nr:GNAT family N-acetyltransferase [Lederbergia citri]MBS4197690.1 GNAT family N-acetyltransferase [Lederbergia citri]
MNRNYKKKELLLENLTEKDIPGLIRLTKSVGWDYNREELTTIFSTGKVYGHRSQLGEVVSAAAVILYDNDLLASIGMVLVNQDYRGLGLGKEVTTICMDSVSRDTTIMLVASIAGEPVYKKLGFETISYVYKVTCDYYIRSNKIHGIQVEISPYSETDFSEVVKLDQKATGVNRRELLLHRINQAKKSLVVKDKYGVIIGFGLSIQGTKSLILGPLVTPNDEIAALLIDKLVGNYMGKLRIDVASGHENFIRFLEKQGFDNVTKRPMMVINPDKFPQRNGTLYGIAGQTYG